MKKLVMLMLVVLLALPAYAAMDFKDLKFTGHYRLRGYHIQNADRTDTNPDLTRYYKQRIWLGVEGNVAENVFANVTLEMEKEWGKGNALPGDPDAKLVFGYVKLSKLFDKDLTLTLGRQAYQLNKNNFVVWDNANGLDGMRLNYVTGDWDMDALYFKVGESALKTGDKTDTEFYGVVANYKGFDKQKVQGYVLFDRAANGDNESDLKQYIGLRVEGAITPVDGLSYIAEYINLSGDNGANPDSDYRSSLYYLNAGYAFSDMKGLKFNVDYLVASGDNGSAGKNKDFQPSSISGNVMLEGNLNFDFGMDAAKSAGLAYQDLKALGIGVAMNPTDKLAVGAKYSILENDKSVAGASKKLGNNLDIFAKYTLSKNHYVCAGYSMFDPKATVGPDKTDYLAAEFRVNF